MTRPSLFEIRSKGYTVYNFEVEDDHTYFVGSANGGVWVHNDCTDIAADIIKRRTDAGLEAGEVWKAQRPLGQDFGHTGKLYGYHDVVRVGDKIIDTFTHGHEDPVEIEQWMQNFDRAVGGDGRGFRQFFDFSPGSGNPSRFARLMGH